MKIVNSRQQKKIEQDSFLNCSLFTIRCSPKQRGFTLIEIAVVLFLMTLMIGLSSFFLANRLPSAGLDSAAREVSAAIRHARALAIMNGEEQVVTVDLDSSGFSMAGRGSRKIPAEIGVMVLDPLYGEIRKGKYEIRFAATGGSQGGDVVLWNRKRTITVRLDPVIGAVSIR